VSLLKKWKKELPGRAGMQHFTQVPSPLAAQAKLLTRLSIGFPRCAGARHGVSSCSSSTL
jgi:hypothetical protein